MQIKSMTRDGGIKMKKPLTARELSLMGIFTALTAVMAQIAIPLPFSPVPISFGLVAVYVTGILLKPKHAIMTQICYLLLGVLGVPVFGNFRSGIAALFGATGGYLMMYPITAGIIAMTLNSRKSRQKEHQQSKTKLFLKSTLSISIAHIILYLGGTVWLCNITESSFQSGLVLAVYPYIPLDIVKIVFCISTIVPLRSRFMSMNLLLLDYTPAPVTKEG